MRGPLAPQRDSGSDKKSFGALNPQAMNPPVIPKHLRRKFVNFAEGDRVCIMKGRDQGRINEVTKVDAENETVTVKDLNMVGSSHCISWSVPPSTDNSRPRWLSPTGSMNNTETTRLSFLCRCLSQ